MKIKRKIRRVWNEIRPLVAMSAIVAMVIGFAYLVALIIVT